MENKTENGIWLERALPIIRRVDAQMHLCMQRRDYIFAIYQEQFIQCTVSSEFDLPEDVYSREGQQLLTKLNQFGEPLAIRWDELKQLSVIFRDEKFVHFRFECHNTNHSMKIPLGESPHVLKAFRLLLPERFNNKFEDEMWTIGIYNQPIYRPERKHDEPRPFQSKTEGTLARIYSVIISVINVIIVSWLLLHSASKGSFEALLQGLFAASCAGTLGWKVSKFFWRYGTQHFQSSLEEKTILDPRPPILYLRSFDDDDLLPATPGHDIAKRLEEHITDVFEECGPVVAIGRPGEPMVSLGAARTYVSDANWQSVVLDLMSKSQLVLLQIAPSEGTWWEFEQSIKHIPPQRLLLILASLRGSQQRYEERRLAAWDLLPQPLSPKLGKALFAYFDKHWHSHLIQPVIRKSLDVKGDMVKVIDFKATLMPLLFTKRLVQCAADGLPNQINPPTE